MIKKFICKTFLFVIPVLIIFSSGIFIPDVSESENLHYAIIDKHKLLRETKKPRIILIGGSNLSFGINSKAIIDSLNINVINTAIHAGYGLKFIIDDIKPYIGEADIILLSPEYNQFFGDLVYGGGALIQLIDAHPASMWQLSLQQWINIIKSSPEYSIDKIRACIFSFLSNKNSKETNSVYKRKSFNKYGDADAHWGKPSQGIVHRGIIGEYNPAAIETIKKFREEIENKCASLIFLYPCLNSGSFILSEDKILKIERSLIKNDITILGTPEKYSFSDSLYYNTHYHLNKKGVDIRTKILIEDLKKVLKNI